MAHIVIVELRLLHQDEPMPQVEAVRVAVPEGTDPQRATLSIRLAEDLGQHGRTEPPALAPRLDIKMIEKQCVAIELQDVEPDPLAILQDVMGVRRRKSGEKPVPGALRIESADALEAFPHGFDAQ